MTPTLLDIINLTEQKLSPNRKYIYLPPQVLINLIKLCMFILRTPHRLLNFVFGQHVSIKQTLNALLLLLLNS